VNLTLHIWRQADRSAARRLVTYPAQDLDPDMSFLEMLDQLNEELTLSGDEPIAFDHDCREGICGTCSLMINGIAHGPDPGTTACQLQIGRAHV
jgi:succinate dehydrogenase / fumarate reductase iron-sulfur subunit